MAMLLVLLVAQPAGAEDGFLDAMMVHINHSRKVEGLLALTWQTPLTWSVGSQVEYLAQSGAGLSHLGVDGSTPSTRAARSGYESDYVAEVLTRGYEDAGDTVRAWMDSEPHRAALLGPGFEDVGVWTARGEDGRRVSGAALGVRRQGAVERVPMEALAVVVLGWWWFWRVFWSSTPAAR